MRVAYREMRRFARARPRLFYRATPSRADMGVIVLEPVGALGFFTRVGHAGIYLSNVCQDGSPIRMRLCAPGDRGGVVSKFSPLSEHHNFGPLFAVF